MRTRSLWGHDYARATEESSASAETADSQIGVSSEGSPPTRLAAEEEEDPEDWCLYHHRLRRFCRWRDFGTGPTRSVREEVIHCFSHH